MFDKSKLKVENKTLSCRDNKNKSRAFNFT